MSDLISRQAAIDAIRELESGEDYNFNNGLICAMNNVAELPSVKPEQKIGKWESIADVIWLCSECKYAHSRSNYCPHCGAKMIKENFKENI